MLGQVDKLQRRNQDYKLLETIKRVGVQNYSLLARLTGLNAETIRYKVNRHLAKLGLSTTIDVNYGQLGLAMGYLTVKPNGSSGKSWSDRMSYVVFAGKKMGSNSHFCLTAVPFRLKKKYLDSLGQLKTEGLIDEYEFKELYWMRYPPFRPEYYDFDERGWKVDWNRFEMTMSEIGPSFIDVNRDSEVDYIDLKILSSMMKDPTMPLAKTAKEIRVNPRTVRYHHAEHVLKNGFILGNNIRWVRPFQERNPSGIVQAVIVSRKLDETGMTKVRKFCNSLPFTWLEAGTEDRTYLAIVDIPMADFQTCVQQVEVHLQGAGDSYEVTMLDTTRTRPLAIPEEMFEPKRGWRLYGPGETGPQQGHLLALGTSSMAATAAWFMGRTPTWDLLLMAYLFSFGGYSINRISDFDQDAVSHPERTAYLKNRMGWLKGAVAFCFGLGYFLAFLRNLVFFSGLLIPLLLAFAYSVGSERMKTRMGASRLKEVTLVKNVTVSFAWSLVPFLVGLYYLQLPAAIFALAPFVFLRLMINTIFFDQRDIDADASFGVRTLPVQMGITASSRVMDVLDLASGVYMTSLIVSGLLPVFSAGLLLFVPYSFAYRQYAKSGKHRDSVRDLVADGEYLLWGVVTALGRVICLGHI